MMVLESLLETQSASVSAARLGLSQSAVSGALKRLRDFFGDPLFERHSHGLTPTRRAEEIGQAVAEILAALRALAEPHVFHPMKAEGTLSILATDYAIATILAPFRSHLAETAPGISCVLQQFTGVDAASSAVLNSMDFIVGSQAMVPNHFNATHLKREELMVFMSHDHPCAQAGPSIEDLCRFPNVLVTLQNLNRRTRLDELLGERGLKRQIATQCPNFLLLPVLLADAKSLSVAPQGLLPAVSDKLVAFPLPLDLPVVEIYAAWHPRHKEDLRHKWLRRELRQIASG